MLLLSMTVAKTPLMSGTITITDTIRITNTITKTMMAELEMMLEMMPEGIRGRDGMGFIFQ